MVRGRGTARGTRRGGAAAASDRPAPATEANEATIIPTTTTTAESTPTESSSSTPARRGGTSARATRGAGTGRFRPKVVRREEADRDSLARQEEKKASERAAAERKSRGRSRYRSNRSRGDAMGSRGGAFGRPITTASGPFASGQAGAGGMRSGGFFGVAGGSGGGRGGGVGGSGGAYKSESKGGAGFGVAREAREMRINADRLHGLTPAEELNSDDEDMIHTLGSRDQSMLPMGIYRQKHKEAEIIVRTTAELEAEENATGAEESLWVDGGTVTPEDQPEEGVWETNPRAAEEEEAAVAVKAEDDDAVMDLDAEVKSVPVPPKKKVLPQDSEEAIINDDLDLLVRELGAVSVEQNGETVTEPADKDGRLYLFQFPPIMPPLKQDGGATPKAASSRVKDEPTDAAPGAAAAEGIAVDLTMDDENNNDNQDSDEDDEDAEERERLARERVERDGFRSQLLSQGGMIGTLNVRKSGKVELTWGGRVMEMSPAAVMNFQTTAVIVEESDEKPSVIAAGAAVPTGGDCVGMGKIMGRFTVAPVWEEEDDWVVGEDELRVPE